jgi:hypothetical protein
MGVDDWIHDGRYQVKVNDTLYGTWKFNINNPLDNRKKLGNTSEIIDRESTNREDINDKLDLREDINEFSTNGVNIDKGLSNIIDIDGASNNK